MPFWIALMISVAFSIAGALLAPKPESPKPDTDPKIPDIDETRPIPKIWGECLITSPQLFWWGDYRATAITKKIFTGIWFKKVIQGYKYSLGMALGLGFGSTHNNVFVGSHAGIEKVTEIQINEKVLWSGSAGVTSVIDIDSPKFYGGNSDGGNGGIKASIEVHTGGYTATLFEGRSGYLQTQLTRTPLWGANNSNAKAALAYLVWRGPSWGSGIGYFGNSSSIETIAVKVVDRPNLSLFLPLPGTETFYAIPGTNDANPVHCLAELFIDGTWGAGSCLETDFDDVSWKAAAETCYNEGNGFSYLWNEQTTCDEMAGMILRQIDGTVYSDYRTGKIAIKLARKDYTIGALETFNNDDFVEIKSLTRGSWDETINEVRVTYTDHAKNFKSVSVFDQDLANFVIQGSQGISTNINYPGVSNEALARTLARRDMKALTLPLLRFEATVDRRANVFYPGGVFIFSWPEQGITSVVMRVTTVNLGTLQNGLIDITCVEDKFAGGTAIFSNTASGWTEPITGALAVANGGIDHLPYHYARDGASRPYAYAARPNGSHLSYQWVLQGAVIDPECAFTPTGTLSAAYSTAQDDFDATGFVVNGFVGDVDGFKTSPSDTDMANGANLIRIDEEWLAFRTWSLVGSVLTLSNIWRGLLDTAPQVHALGARVWFLGAHIQLTEQTFPVSTALTSEFLTQTATGGIDSATAPDYSLTLNNRPILPYVPGQLGKTDTSSITDGYDSYVVWTNIVNMGQGPTTTGATGANGLIYCNSNYWWNGKADGNNIAPAGDSCEMTFKASQTNAWATMGLGSGPATQDQGACVELGWWIKGNAKAEVWESGVLKTAVDAFAYTTSSVFRIKVYTTGVVEYIIDGVVKYTSAIAAATVQGWALRPNAIMGYYGGNQTGGPNSVVDAPTMNNVHWATPAAGGGGVASGQVDISWPRRNRLTQTTVIRQNTADITPEASQLTRVRFYNNVTNALLHTYDDLAGTTQTYLGTLEATENGTLCSQLRVEVEAKRGTDFSYTRQVKILLRPWRLAGTGRGVATSSGGLKVIKKLTGTCTGAGTASGSLNVHP